MAFGGLSNECHFYGAPRYTSKARLRTCDVLNPVQDAPAADLHGQHGRRRAVEAEAEDEVLLKVDSSGCSLRLVDDRRPGVCQAVFLGQLVVGDARQLRGEAVGKNVVQNGHRNF